MSFTKESQTKKQPKIKTKTILTIAQLKKKVQRAVNAHIRLRDKDEPCISCQRKVDDKDAGHYIAQGSSGALRYHLDNLSGQCLSCNRFKHGNLIEYRQGLIKKIGKERVEWLEEHRHDVKKWTREELEQILADLKLPIA